MLIVREESSTLTTGTTEWIWSPTSPRLGWFSQGQDEQSFAKALNNCSSPILRKSLSAENKISKLIHSYKFQDSEVKTLAKKGEFESFLSKLFQISGRVSRCSYQTSILFWRSSFSWRSQWANIHFFYNWSSSLCHSSFKVHMLSLTASRTNFVILFYSIKMKIFSLLYGYNIV